MTALTVATLRKRAEKIRPLRRILANSRHVNCVRFSPDSRQIAIGGAWTWLTDLDSDETLTKDNALNYAEPPQDPAASSFPVPSLNDAFVCEFSPDGKYLVTGGRGPVSVWETKTKKRVGVEGFAGMAFSGSGINNLAVSPDGQMLATCDQSINLFRVHWGDPIRLERVDFPRAEMRPTHFGAVNSVNFSRDNKLLAAGSDDDAVSVYEIESRRLLWRQKEHSASVTSVAFSPDMKFLASGSGDNTVRVWDSTAGELVKTFKAPGRSLKAVAWSPDGSLLFSRSQQSELGVCIWHVEHGEAIHAIPQLPAQSDDRWSSRALGVSPDGNFLASFPPETLSALQVWDISPVTNLTGATETSAVLRRVTPVSVNRKAINAHLLTLPLAHATPPTPSRPASWLRGAATIGSTPPLFVVQDLGTVLTQPQAALARPRFLPSDVDTSAYLDFLHRLSVQPLLRRVSSWDISDSMAGVVIARLIEGIKFSAEYRMSEQTDVVTFARALGTELDRAQPEDLWRQTDPAQRPGLNALLPAEARAKIETNLRRLDPDELRFLNQYGPRFSGAPDPRELLDLFSLLDVPPAVQQSLTQMLRLIPRISQCRSGGGSQTYAMGGYAGITNKGSLDSLVPTELAYPSDVLLHRLLNQEALYYGRETERERSRELVYLVTQSGLELLGDGDVLAKALTLALAQTMHRRGYEVQQSFVGSAWTEPATMLRPADVHRVLYHRDRSSLRPKEMLEAVLAQLREWSERYRTLQVMWIVGEHWDADDCAAHRDLYNAVRTQAEQQAWFIRVGKGEASGRRKNPPAARLFGQHQVIGSELMWAGMDAPKRIFVAPESKPAVMPKPVASIRFDGLYLSEIKNEGTEVLRFFENGVVLSGSIDDKVLLTTLLSDGFQGKGAYTVKGSDVELKIVFGYSAMEGFGSILPDGLRLEFLEYTDTTMGMSPGDRRSRHYGNRTARRKLDYRFLLVEMDTVGSALREDSPGAY